jgi:hypothetical protein
MSFANKTPTERAFSLRTRFPDWTEREVHNVANGYSRHGWKHSEEAGGYLNVTTGTLYDTEGWSARGWNSEHVWRETGTLFNTDGYDYRGLNPDGWFKTDVDHNHDRDYWIRNQYLGRTHIINGLTGIEFDPNSFNFYGFDEEGFDREGYKCYGDERRGRVNRDGFNRQGWYVGRDGWYPGEPFNRKGIFKSTRTKFDRRGFDYQGFNAEGFSAGGYHESKWDLGGVDREGFNREGRNKAGFNRAGFNKRGWNKHNLNETTGTYFDDSGWTESGYDRQGVLRAPGIYGAGRDAFGYNEDGIRDRPLHGISGYNHLRGIARFADRDFAKEGWLHSFTQGWSEKRGTTSIVEGFTHRDTGTHFDPDGFTVVGYNSNQITVLGFDLRTKLHITTGTSYGLDGWNLMRNELRSILQ